MRYTGGPPTIRDRLNNWFAPRGAPYLDGVRLAVINTIGLVAALVVIGLVSLITRLLGSLVPLPFWLTGFIAVAALIALAVWFWYRYATAHLRAVRVRRRGANRDVFGAIAAAPFAFVGLVLLATGLLSLFLATMTFSLARVVDAMQQFLFAALFLGVGLVNIIIARAATD